MHTLIPDFPGLAPNERAFRLEGAALGNTIGIVRITRPVDTDPTDYFYPLCCDAREVREDGTETGVRDTGKTTSISMSALGDDPNRLMVEVAAMSEEALQRLERIRIHTDAWSRFPIATT
jgi:hypothetical protein